MAVIDPQANTSSIDIGIAKRACVKGHQVLLSGGLSFS
jgi:hypothetical protein